MTKGRSDGEIYSKVAIADMLKNEIFQEHLKKERKKVAEEILNQVDRMVFGNYRDNQKQLEQLKTKYKVVE